MCLIFGIWAQTIVLIKNPFSMLPLAKNSAASASPKVSVEFMPGRVMEMEAPEPAKVPKFVVAKLARQANGTYALIPQQWNMQMRLTNKLCRDFGLQCSRKIIYNLIRAGLVKGTMISPRNTMVDIYSLVEHLHRCQVGAGRPVFWTRANVEKYLFASIGAVEECDEDNSGEE